jgi:preprotein translocase subunit SecG
MSLVIGLLTFILVINSILLMLLILIQLPKKDAGAGLAFGAGTTDALFGAGSGTVLTKLTKYATGAFLLLCLTLSIMQTHRAKTTGRGVLTELERKASTLAVTPAVVPTNAPTPILPNPLTGAVPPALRALITNAPVALPASPATPASNSQPVPLEDPQK